MRDVHSGGVVDAALPEEPPFWEWLTTNGRALSLSERKLRTGDFLAEVQAVQAMPSPPPPTPSGITEAAKILSSYRG
jgi:hypothetical protein